MTRGRRKDMTIPPSRALLQQRDYRARKAQYLADLEVRVKKAEDENVVLRKEVEALQAKLAAAAPSHSPAYGPEVVRLPPRFPASGPVPHSLTPLFPAPLPVTGCSIFGPHAPPYRRCSIHHSLPATRILPWSELERARPAHEPHPYHARDPNIHALSRSAARARTRARRETVLRLAAH